MCARAACACLCVGACLVRVCVCLIIEYPVHNGACVCLNRGRPYDAGGPVSVEEYQERLVTSGGPQAGHTTFLNFNPPKNPEYPPGINTTPLFSAT